MPTGLDLWQLLFFAAAALIFLLHVWRGWRLGVVRQITSILAFLAALAAGWFMGPWLAPVLRPLGLPERVLGWVGGALLGLLTFLLIWGLSSVLFKKTSHQSIGLIRWGYGAAGALIGAVLGLANVWVFFLSIRLLGSLARSELEPARAGEPARGSALIRAAAHMSASLEEGPLGALAARLDPVPESFHRILAKLGRVSASEQRLVRFLKDPAVHVLLQNPRVAALQNDGPFLRDLLNRDFVALARNPRVIELVDDPEIARILARMNLEKALDNALAKPDNRDPSPPAH